MIFIEFKYELVQSKYELIEFDVIQAGFRSENFL